MKQNVKIFAKTIEDAAYEQVSKLSECEAYKNCEIRVCQTFTLERAVQSEL